MFASKQLHLNMIIVYNQSQSFITPGNRPNNSSLAITTFSADKSNELTIAQKMAGSKILVDHINNFSDTELQIKSQWDINFSEISKFPKEIKFDIIGKKAIEPQGTNYCEVLQYRLMAKITSRPCNC